MTHQNKAREALERLANTPMNISLEEWNEIVTHILTILERLEGVDWKAIQLPRSIQEAETQWINGRCTGWEYDLLQAARLYAAQTSATPVDLIDPLAGTPDGLVEG